MELVFNTRMKSHHESGGLIDKHLEKKQVTEKDFLEFLDKEPENVERAIYVHTPYCDKICSFCNLNRKQLDGSLDEYSEYIVSEFDKYGKTKYFKDRPFEVIFFGGGTPTVYRPYQLENILKSIERNVKFADGYEFTFESTLHNLNKEKLDIMMKYGVNRISVGIQSFSDEGRVFYNRTYTKAETIRRLKELKEYFKGDVCVDIIYNYPNQKEEDVREDARIIKELGISSSSFYSLMVHEGSHLSKDIKDEKVVMTVNYEREKKLHDIFVNELCKDDEYYVLELTKIAKKDGDNYQYIKVRNNGGDTFPIGAGAGGNVGNFGVFRMNKMMSFFGNRTDLHKKYGILSGLMQFPVLSKKDIKKLLGEEYKYFVEKAEYYKDKKLFTETEENYELTLDGLFWGNNIANDITNYIIEKHFEK
ncbi:radical SAM protein [Fusobacterium sp.]|uniref:radical SAM protein n=1 Tax=Fusobacterium sp. TaxID=68766 RepID=UPI00260A9243|nr:radical SAM protein [Fusobacterium sp.]